MRRSHMRGHWRVSGVSSVLPKLAQLHFAHKRTGTFATLESRVESSLTRRVKRRRQAARELT